jgi:CobQ-like glutamine amidotransferase family enzyme
VSDRPFLRIGYLYPDVMNLYGDRGNAIALKRRCEARGIEAEVVPIGLGEPFDARSVDILLIGGGQDREQRRVAADLQEKGPTIRAAAEEGFPMLAVCGGFQLFGHRYVDHTGEVIPGIGVFDMETRHPGLRADRCIGDIVVESPFGELAGFENHGGRTYLAPGQEPLGRVVRGFGNNGEDGTEGARRGNAIGTYLHGSVLPKNPVLADALIAAALRRRYGDSAELPPLDDRYEAMAHAAAVRTAERRARPARGAGRRA